MRPDQKVEINGGSALKWQWKGISEVSIAYFLFLAQSLWTTPLVARQLLVRQIKSLSVAVYQ